MADKKVAVFDWDAGEFVLDPSKNVVTATRTAAVAQIAQKAARTERGIYIVYMDEDPDLNHKYGTDVMEVLRATDLDEATRLSEITRTVREALIYDPYITDVTNIEVDSYEEGYGAAYDVDTIFGTTIRQEVTI